MLYIGGIPLNPKFRRKPINRNRSWNVQALPSVYMQPRREPEICLQVISYWCNPRTGDFRMARNSCEANRYRKMGYVKVNSREECSGATGVSNGTIPMCNPCSGDFVMATQDQIPDLKARGYIKVKSQGHCRVLNRAIQQFISDFMTRRPIRILPYP